MALEILSLEEKHLEDAASLVCARYRALRGTLPVMPARFEAPDAILPQLHHLAGQAPGAAAIQGSKLAGFLVAYQFPDFRGKQSIYSPEWANGTLVDGSRRIYESLYTELAAQWVDSGYNTHLLSIMANDQDGIEGWRWLGFGLLATDGVRDLEPVPEAVSGRATGVDLRRAVPGDTRQVTALIEALRRHMAASPTFLHQEDSVGTAENVENLADPAHALWLAYQGTEAVACMGQGPANPRASDLISDTGTTSIVSAYTRENARGAGVATALLNQVLVWAREEGYERCAVDWEPMNVLATRFWTRYFRPVSYAMIRHIEERLTPTTATEG
ncbi:MAG: GNAT family N-acetyltransferase [Anaerolineae bacterium]|nr:GNAT family N-acetyltransferase [Anaerolineae bacterium]